MTTFNPQRKAMASRHLAKYSDMSLEDTAFRTFIKNRVFHGGIIAEWSGLLKHGENGCVLSRWYPATLANRIKTIAAMRDRLVFYEGDAFDFMKLYASYNNTVFFVDPPYTASKKKLEKDCINIL